MKAFAYDRPTSVAAAVRLLAAEGTLLKAAGIDVLDRLKERVDEPDRVVTLVDVPGLASVEATATGVRIGAMATLADLAASPLVRAASPALAEAAGWAASPALRNRATLGGNLGQHTRCGYYRLKSFPCFKRGDAICPVRIEGGVAENAGVFENAPCACAHPSSLAPVLAAAQARAEVAGPGGTRGVPLADLFAPVRQGQTSDLALARDEVIVAIDVPGLTAQGGREGAYEVRQKAAFDWALVTAAARYEVAEGRIAKAGVWLGSVAPTPYRAAAAEQALVGAVPGDEAFASAAEAAVSGATPLAPTAYKLDLVKAAVRRALGAAQRRAS